MNLYQPTITGSLSVSGSINISGSINVVGGGGTITGTASYATNAELLDGLDSTVFTLTSSFAAQTASFTAFTSSVNTFTASINSFSASVLSYTSSLNAKTSSFATTGSNTFEGIQTINSNLTVTGSITAQTLIVSTINATQSYSSGSNIFGNSQANTQTFTGSMSVSGSAVFSEQLTATSPSTLFKEGFIVKATTTGGGGSQPAYTYYTAAGSKRWSSFLNVGDDKLHIANALNSEVFTIIQSGSVGIGTTSPSYLFDITKSSDSNTSLAYIKNTATGRPAYLSFKTPLLNFVTGIKDDVGYVIANNDGTISSNSVIDFAISNSGITTMYSDNGSQIQAVSANAAVFSMLNNSAGTNRGYFGFGSISTTNMNLWNIENGSLLFGCNNSLKMTLTSNGTLGVGITTGTYNGRFCIEGDGATTSNVHLEMSTDANRGYFQSANRVTIADAPLTIGCSSLSINYLTTGTVYSTSGVLSISSDKNLKNDDGEIENALSKVLQLNPRYFYWKEESGLPTDLRQLGFYAQEVNEVLGEEVANTPKTEKDSWGIYDRAIIAMLTKAIQEQQAQIEAQQQQINTLLNK